MTAPTPAQIPRANKAPGWAKNNPTPPRNPTNRMVHQLSPGPRATPRLTAAASTSSRVAPSAATPAVLMSSCAWGDRGIRRNTINVNAIRAGSAARDSTFGHSTPKLNIRYGNNAIAPQHKPNARMVTSRACGRIREHSHTIDNGQTTPPMAQPTALTPTATLTPVMEVVNAVRSCHSGGYHDVTAAPYAAPT